MFRISLLTILWLVHLTHALPGGRSLPSGELDYPSNEDSTYQPPSDDSISAWKDEEVWSEQESDADSAEPNTDTAYDDVVDDNIKNNDGDVPLEKQPTKPKKKSASVLEQVCDKADRYSRNLEKAVGMADRKMTDWTRRITQFRFHIFGPMRQGGMNGYGNGGGNNYWGGGGGGGYGGMNGNNGVSLMGAYYTIWPFIKELGSALNKVLMYGSKLAAELFVAAPAPSRRRARQGARSAKSSRYGGRKSPGYQNRGRGRGRAGGAGAARRTRATTVFARQREEAYSAYNDRDDADDYQ